MCRLAPAAGTALYLIVVYICLERITVATSTNCPPSTITRCSIVVLNEEPNSTSTGIISTTAGNYSVTASCKCTLGYPTWRYMKFSSHKNIYTKIDVAAVQHYCISGNNTIDECQGIGQDDYASDFHAYANITDYIVEESTILLCGDGFRNYAEPLVIIITESDDESSYEDILLTLNLTTSNVPSKPTSVSTTSTSTTSLPTIITSSSSNRRFEITESFSCIPSIVEQTSTRSIPEATIIAERLKLAEDERDQYQLATAILSVVVGALVVAILILIFLVVKGNRNVRSQESSFPHCVCLENFHHSQREHNDVNLNNINGQAACEGNTSSSC